MEIMGRIRDALAEKLFQTAVLDRDAREQIYIRVQAIDAMISEMTVILANNASEHSITEYAERLATTEK